MAVDREPLLFDASLNRPDVEYHEIKLKGQTIEQVIKKFLKNYNSIPKNRFYFAKNQIYSLYRRMKSQSKMKDVYKNEILKTIRYERGGI